MRLSVMREDGRVCGGRIKSQLLCQLSYAPSLDRTAFICRKDLENCDQLRQDCRLDAAKTSVHKRFFARNLCNYSAANLSQTTCKKKGTHAACPPKNSSAN